MIKTVREDRKERVLRSGQVIPAYSRVHYFGKDGYKIAFYDGYLDCLYLNTKYIGESFRQSAYEKALACPRANEYKELFALLGIDKSSHVSEYTNL